MGLLSNLKELFSKPKDPQLPPMGPPDAKFLGDWLVYEFLGDKFGLDDQQMEECVAELPNELREMTKFWILSYLSWILKAYAGSKYGDRFAEDLQTHAIKRFEKGESLNPELQGLSYNFKFWMEHIEDNTHRAGVEVVEGVEIPFEVFVAMSFLALDEGSPFYHAENIDGGLDFDVGIALELAKEKTIKLIAKAVDVGRPVEPS